MTKDAGASDMGGMFLWWLTPNVQNNLAEREDRESREEKERQEILESERGLQQSFSKPSKISKAKYNQWLLSEEKRTQGEEGRFESEGHKYRSQMSAMAFASAVHERTQAMHDERDHAADQVHMLRMSVANRGSEARSVQRQNKSKQDESNEAYRMLGSQNRQTYGVEQRQRVHESLKQQRESNHSQAYEYKQRVAGQAAEQAQRDEARLQEKRERVARIRAETDAQCVRSAKEYYYSGRKQTADSVRNDVTEWSAEKQRNFDAALARARSNRAAAINSATAAIDEKVALQEHNRQVAQQMKVSLHAVEDRRKHLQSLDDLKKRRAYENAVEAQFVNKSEARQVENSTLMAMANAHREELASAQVKERKIIPRGNWVNHFFRSTGMFHSWFGGSSTTVAEL